MDIVFQPIGFIKTKYKNTKDIPRQGIFENTPGEIVLNESYIGGIQGISDLEHIIVLFHFHKSKGFNLLQQRGGDKSIKLSGVFATRSPFRPNGIGMSVVKVVDVSNNTIHFTGADMLDGTPVLDIKPYSSSLVP
jgi:tRNA-Thr(GGU) m(6)t(6)A37 methyltransferase TsaA